jgi:hypothetical protein
MGGEILITTDKDEFIKILDNYKNQESDVKRRERIIQNYSEKYKIEDEIAIINRRQVHIDYIPSLDAILEAGKSYENPEEVVGAALFKIEKDHCIFLTDSWDRNMSKIYDSHRKEADEMAKRLWEINSKDFDLQFTHCTAAVLAGSFEIAFDKTYGTWRLSLI